jgi:hypothetical protein
MQPPIKQIVVFSHGFGVAKDSNGFFTDIAAALGPSILPVLFDYNDFDAANRTMTILPLKQQAAILEAQLVKVRHDHPNVPITIIGHSQGSIVVALADLGEVRQVILLTPISGFSTKPLQRPFANLIKPVRLPDGTVRIPKRDGSAILIPPGYQPERADIIPYKEYNALATHTDLTIIHAAEDDIIDGSKAQDVRLSDTIKVIILPGDHNFTGAARVHLIETIQKTISIKD